MNRTWIDWRQANSYFRWFDASIFFYKISMKNPFNVVFGCIFEKQRWRAQFSISGPHKARMGPIVNRQCASSRKRTSKNALRILVFVPRRYVKFSAGGLSANSVAGSRKINMSRGKTMENGGKCRQVSRAVYVRQFVSMMGFRDGLCVFRVLPENYLCFFFQFIF